MYIILLVRSAYQGGVHCQRCPAYSRGTRCGGPRVCASLWSCGICGSAGLKVAKLTAVCQTESTLVEGWCADVACKARPP